MFTRDGTQRLTTLWSTALSGVIALTLGCGDGGAPGVAERTGPASPMAPTTESESSTRGLPAAGPLDSPAPDGARVDPYALPDGLFSATPSGDLTGASVDLPFFGATSSSDPAFRVRQTGVGHGGWFEVINSGNNRHGLVAYTNGGGHALRALNQGTGRAVWGQINNPSSPGQAILGTTSGRGNAVHGLNVGSQGGAGFFQINNFSNDADALTGLTNGTGSAGLFEIDNVSSSADALQAFTNGGSGSSAIFARTTGSASAGRFVVFNIANSAAAVDALSVGTGPTVRAVAQNTGSAGVLEIVNASNTNPALRVATNGGIGSDAISARTTGGGNAGAFEIDNPANDRSALFATTNGASSAAVLAINSGGGPVGVFSTFASNTDEETILAINDGTGPAGKFQQTGVSGEVLWVERTIESSTTMFRTRAKGESGNFAVFEVGDDNRIRFDKTGKGFFDGGTATGGADLAEAFDVVGPAGRYEPGDVLAISTERDRAVEKSAEAYSTRVIGVYATKPGVVLGEAVEGLSGKRIPVAVTGVVPTKVTATNGAIRRGDILVASSRAGYAMRGQSVEVQGMKLFPNGSIIGKALEPFEGPGTRKILVMVNVK